MRYEDTDKYMEKLFGKPDYTKSFINIENGLVYTPFKGVKLWRIDKPTEEQLLFLPYVNQISG